MYLVLPFFIKIEDKFHISPQHYTKDQFGYQKKNYAAIGLRINYKFALTFPNKV